MARDLAEAFERQWREYRAFYDRGAVFAALVRVGAIANCLRNAGVDNRMRSHWGSMLHSVRVTDSDARAVREELTRRLQRIHEIVSVGTHFTYEELLLVLTTRIELGLVSEFCAERGIDFGGDVGLADEEILAVTRLPANARAFRSAQASAQRNWGIPFHSHWLGGFTVQ